MNSAPLSLIARFAMILDGLCRAVAARSAGGALAGPLIVLIWGRIRRIERHVLRLLTRFQAGRLSVRKAPVVAAARRSRPRGPNLLPRSQGWLIGLVPYHAAAFSSQLQHLLGDPEMIALLAVSKRARALLAPLCRMLAIEPALLTPVGVPADAEMRGGDGTVTQHAALTHREAVTHGGDTGRERGAGAEFSGDPPYSTVRAT